MELTLWTYEGPPHVGAIRVAASMRDVHLMLHSPQGDTYADLLFTMIERDGRRPPVTYTTFQARDLGSSSARNSGCTELPSLRRIDIAVRWASASAAP